MAAAFAATTSLSATAVMLPRLSIMAIRCSGLPQLPARSFATSIKQFSVSRRSSMFQIKASEGASPVDANELFDDLKEKWDALENKSTVIVYGGGAVVAIWLFSIFISAVNSVPLLPKILELVGLGYTGWFVIVR